MEVHNGTIGELGEQRLGTIATGESRTYTFDVSLDQAAGNDAQVRSAQAAYTYATQSADAED